MFPGLYFSPNGLMHIRNINKSIISKSYTYCLEANCCRDGIDNSICMGKIWNLSCFNAFEIHSLQNKHNARFIKKKKTLNSINIVEQYAPYLQLFFLPFKILTILSELKSQGTFSTIALSVSPSLSFLPSPQTPDANNNTFYKIQQHFISTFFMSFILQCFFVQCSGPPFLIIALRSSIHSFIKHLIMLN